MCQKICPIEINRLLNFQNDMQETCKYASLNAALQYDNTNGWIVQHIVKELKKNTLTN
jgi:hypothetical protein